MCVCFLYTLELQVSNTEKGHSLNYKFLASIFTQFITGWFFLWHLQFFYLFTFIPSCSLHYAMRLDLCVFFVFFFYFTRKVWRDPWCRLPTRVAGWLSQLFAAPLLLVGLHLVPVQWLDEQFLVKHVCVSLCTEKVAGLKPSANNQCVWPESCFWSVYFIM